MKQKQFQKQEGRQGSSLLLKLFALLAFMLVGVNGAWAIGISKEVALPETKTQGEGSWDKGSKMLSWTQAYSNAIDVTSAAQDLSEYVGITVDSENLSSGASFRIMLVSGKNTFQYVMNTAGVHQIKFSDFKIENSETAISDEELKSAKIQMAGRYGNGNQGSVKINRLGLIQVKWWNNYQATISDPDDFSTFGASQNGNSFTYSDTWHEVRIYLDGFDAKDISSVEWNTSNNSVFKINVWKSGQNDYYSLAAAQAANAKITELRLGVTQNGTYTINSVVFNQGLSVIFDNTIDKHGCDVWYTLGDDDNQIRDSRYGIAPGTMVHYRGNDDNGDTWVINGWYKNEVPKNGDGGFFKYGNWDVNINDIQDNHYGLPEFQNTHIYIANAGDGGSAIVYAKNDANKVNISGNKYKSWEMTGGVVFEATATEQGYEFSKWDDDNTDNPREVTEHVDGHKYIYTAIFKKQVNYHNKPNCGNNPFDQSKLNAGTGATMEYANGGQTVTVGNGGGYVSFHFETGLNLSEIYQWSIGSDNNDNVAYVGFYKDGQVARAGEQTMEFYRNATGRVLEDNFKSGLTSVDEIRIGFKASTTTHINYFMLDLRPEGMFKVPTLAAPTKTEMVIYQGEVLGLHITDSKGFWREYTDGNYNVLKKDRILKNTDQEYSSSYDFSGLEVGHYYFEVKHGETCKLGHYHTTEAVRVHVEVKPTPTNLHVTYDLNGGTGTAPVDNNSYNYKAEATVLGPGNISLNDYYFAYWTTEHDGSGEKYSTDSDLGATKITVSGDITLYAHWVKKGFKGFFNYENRLVAQWNFDLCDGARFHEQTAAASSIWTASAPVVKSNGESYVDYTLNVAIGSMQGIEPVGGELVYDNSGTNAGVKIPIAAGLKFTADANTIKIRVTKKGGEIYNTQLIIEPGVKMEIPYVRNSYRNDAGDARSAYSWTDAYNSKEEKWENASNDFYPDRFEEYKDCIHHVNRDIVYMISEPTIWDGAVINKCYDDDTRDLFNNGGDENAHGVRNGGTKKWIKYNYTGNQGAKCILTFAKETTIDRIGVNRNLIYSYYTENIAETSDNAYSKPIPGLRIIGSPRGAKVADVGATYATYSDAIAMTYGGWPHNGNTYKNGANETVNDFWGNLTVYHGNNKEGDNDYSSDKYDIEIDVKVVPVATDGFPVYSNLSNNAYNESVNPANNTKYHDASYGYYQYADNSSIRENAYLKNFTPWTLPSRGAYVKFEPTYPGVLNVHILQDGLDNGTQHYYYIADEFGNIVKDNVFTKTGTGASNPVNQTSQGYFYVNKKDNVKYSFDVYPGKTYYLFSNTGGMGVTGFNFEPYVYRQYSALSQVPATITVNKGTDKQRDITLTAEDKEFEYELARQDVGIKTAEMTAGPSFSFLPTTDVKDYTNQTASFDGGSQIDYQTETKTYTWGGTYKAFKFDEDGNKIPSEGVTLETWAASDKSTVSAYPNKPNTNVNPLKYDNKAVRVKLARSFKAQQWQTICLPYSMNNLQLETVFGEGTKVVLLRDVQKACEETGGLTIANFVYHMNQDIIAGYPYLIYPARAVSSIETNAYLDGTVAYEGGNTYYAKDIDGSWTAPGIIEISGEGPNIVTYNGPNYGGHDCYTSTANYNATTNVPKGSYVLSNGKLTRITNESGITAGAFMSYLKYTGGTDGTYMVKTRIDGTNFGDVEFGETTDIEDVLLESGIVGSKTDVYSINGVKVRQNTDDLRGLSKGIYIVNGKKYIVK